MRLSTQKAQDKWTSVDADIMWFRDPFSKFDKDADFQIACVNEQDVFNKIKFNPFIENVGLRIRFLDTGYFGGFCQASKDLNKVCTMHANCCVGLENKVHDLGIMLGDWRKYKESPANQMTRGSAGSWTVPQLCRWYNQESADRVKGGLISFDFRFCCRISNLLFFIFGNFHPTVLATTTGFDD
ncbi:hypothetical protein L1987_73782 [Smallanthus sonchifolius]|uniref:Uncharacterized protein n=1 Tax=Smallanthus sonchifolius TaxID=185202 RepID=A0ACB9A0F5_9ASTR|nr:hypothetical protein L1987_73782 [Smallanthus sonchifolius]